MIFINCDHTPSVEENKSADKAREYISAQYPKINWTEAYCYYDLRPDSLGFRGCKVYSKNDWFMYVRCTPEKCICEICESLKND